MKNPIAALHNDLRQEMLSLNKLLLDHLKSNVPLVSTVAEHLIMAGGKRLRPVLTLACQRLFGHTLQPDTLRLAVSVELIHNATLLHDDVVDDSKLRRGNDTANALFGNTSSVLVGDFLFSRAFQLMVECHTPGVLKILADASALIAEGEVMQLSHSHRWDLEMEMYLEIIERKTSVLFEAACCVGAMAGNATPEQVYHIAAFGRFFGMIFQMTDDLLDYFPIRDYGKQLGDDFFHGKITLPILMLRDVVPQKKWLNHLFDTTTKRTFDDFKALKDVFETYTIFDTCMDFIACYADKAIHALKEIPESHLRDRLERCVQHVIDRCYDADKAREAIA